MRHLVRWEASQLSQRYLVRISIKRIIARMPLLVLFWLPEDGISLRTIVSFELGEFLSIDIASHFLKCFFYSGLSNSRFLSADVRSHCRVSMLLDFVK